MYRGGGGDVLVNLISEFVFLSNNIISRGKEMFVGILRFADCPLFRKTILKADSIP